MFYSKKFNLKPGDRIIVPKSGFRIIQHHALFLGQNYHGVDLIAENKLGCGVRLITADDFFKDVIDVTDIVLFNGSNFERKIVVQKALKKIGEPYDLINYNCEHFANEIQTGKVESFQIEKFLSSFKIAALVLILLGFVSLIANDK